MSKTIKAIAPSNKKGKGGGKNKKFGRNKAKCMKYWLNDTERKNKRRNMIRELKKNPKNKGAAVILDTVFNVNPATYGYKG